MTHDEEEPAPSCTEVLPSLYRAQKEVLEIVITILIPRKVGLNIGDSAHATPRTATADRERIEKKLLTTHPKRCLSAPKRHDPDSGEVVLRSEGAPPGSRLKDAVVPVDFLCTSCLTTFLAHLFDAEVFCEGTSLAPHCDGYCVFRAPPPKASIALGVDTDGSDVRPISGRVLTDPQSLFLNALLERVYSAPMRGGRER